MAKHTMSREVTSVGLRRAISTHFALDSSLRDTGPTSSSHACITACLQLCLAAMLSFHVLGMLLASTVRP